MAGRKGVLFDTSVWSPIDLLDFYRQIPPEQVVYASDYPYGQQPASLLIAVKTARLAGYSEDQVRAMLAGTANALADGAELPEPDAAGRRSDTFAQPMQLARIHQYLSMATPLLWSRQPDTVGVLGLAIAACSERNGHIARSTGSGSCSRRREPVAHRSRPANEADRRDGRGSRSASSTWPTSRR